MLVNLQKSKKIIYKNREFDLSLLNNMAFVLDVDENGNVEIDDKTDRVKTMSPDGKFRDYWNDLPGIKNIDALKMAAVEELIIGKNNAME